MGFADFSDAANAPRLNGSLVPDSELENVWAGSSLKIDGVLTKYRVRYLGPPNNQYNTQLSHAEITVDGSQAFLRNPRNRGERDCVPMTAMEPELEPLVREAKQGGRFEFDAEGKLKDKVEQKDGTGKERIRCPKCKWNPKPSDRWACQCGHTWNTFDTRGKCPGCLFQWTQTMCLSCLEWSEHEAWYEPQGAGGQE